MVYSMQLVGCLIYYHSKCVGLDQLKSKRDGKVYSNCDDGSSYICPWCKRKRQTDDNVSKNDGHEIDENSKAKNNKNQNSSFNENSSPIENANEHLQAQSLTIPIGTMQTIKENGITRRRTTRYRTTGFIRFLNVPRLR